MIQYNHSRSLSDFTEQITKIKINNFNPIAVAQIYFEDTFVFETSEEAIAAYNQLERNSENVWIGEVSGWWYGKEEFLKLVDDYEKESEYKVLIHWI